MVEEEDVYLCFFVNPNVQSTGRCLRGLLVARTASVGVSLKANRQNAIYVLLLPYVSKPKLISLASEGLEPLQQVLGSCLSKTFERRGIRTDGNGKISMSPHGPDLRFVRTSQIPYHLGRVICGQSEGVGKTLIKS